MHNSPPLFESPLDKKLVIGFAVGVFCPGFFKRRTRMDIGETFAEISNVLLNLSSLTQEKGGRGGGVSLIITECVPRSEARYLRQDIAIPGDLVK